MSAIGLSGVTRVHAGGTVAVNRLDLEVQDGEFLVLVGPSGSGKTTTLRLIAGLDSPSAGQIRIGGRVVNGLSPRERDLALVFQNQALYPHLTVFQNLAFGLRLRQGYAGFGRLWRRCWQPRKSVEFEQRLRSRIAEVAETLGIENLLDRRPAQLSGGEQQRVALGRGLVRQPQAYLFDEPLAHLDAELKTELRHEFKRLRSASGATVIGATVIYVTHDQAEAMSLADRLVVLNRGTIQQIGKPQQVYERPANMFVARFIGTPGMNLIEGVLSPNETSATGETMRFATAGGSLAVDKQGLEALKRYAGKPVVLGLRAEHLEFVEEQGGATDDSTGQTASAEVEFVEPQGDVQLVSLRLGESRLDATETSRATAPQHGRVVMKVGAAGTLHQRALSRSQRVRIRLDMRRACWFDPQTTQSICL
jgi:multiple sugar transport system ATP-binding protein